MNLRRRGKKGWSKITCNTGYSLVVTDPTTNPALSGLSMGERTGSRIFHWVWSHVIDTDEVMIIYCILS